MSHFKRVSDQGQEKTRVHVMIYLIWLLSTDKTKFGL
jgi:hypothetical protein